MAALTQTPSSRRKGGGNYVLAIQINKAADGTFEALATADCFGEAAGSVHELGSVESKSYARDDNAVNKFDVNIVEQSIAFKNLLINAAPYSTTAASSTEELILEDGTTLESADTTTADDTKPYFQFIVFDAPTAAGKEQAFFFVGQMSRSGGWDTKAKSYAKPKYSISSVDANGFVCTLPSTVTYPRVTGLVAPTLADEKAHGVWVEES